MNKTVALNSAEFDHLFLFPSLDLLLSLSQEAKQDLC